MSNEKVNTSKKCLACGKLGHIATLNAAIVRTSDCGNFALIAVSSVITSQINNEWYLNSGASQHMCKEKTLFCTFMELDMPKYVKIGDGTTLQAVGQGNICILVYNGVNFHCVMLYEVLFGPQIKVNLFSKDKTLDTGISLIYDAEKAQFVNK